MIERIKIITLLISMAAAVLMVVSQLLDIRKKLATEKELLNSLRASFLVRNWRMLLVAAVGVAGMFSISLGPLTPSSVLWCVLGGVFTAIAAAGMAILDIAGRLTQQVLGVLVAHDAAQRETMQRVVSVMDALVAPAQPTTDKPD